MAECGIFGCATDGTQSPADLSTTRDEKHEGMEVQVFTHEDRHDLGRGRGKGTQAVDVHDQ